MGDEYSGLCHIIKCREDDDIDVESFLRLESVKKSFNKRKTVRRDCRSPHELVKQAPSGAVALAGFMVFLPLILDRQARSNFLQFCLTFYI